MGCLGEGGSRDGGIGDHCFVVSKHVALGLMGTPRYMSARQRSMIWSTAALVATNSQPKEAVQTVDCLL